MTNTLFERVVSLIGATAGDDEDYAQDAWVAILTFLHGKGEDTPNAATKDELIEQYQENAGMVGRAFLFAKTNALRQGKPTRQVNFDDDLLIEELEDTNDYFESIEIRDELNRRLGDLTDAQKCAILRFIDVWIDQEKGLPISDARRKQLSRDRKAHNMPLVLKYGGHTRRRNDDAENC